MKAIVAYTDGACRGNPGPGGWGVVLQCNGREKELCGGEPATTNNRMEMTAAIRALEALTEPCRVDLYTDSVYVRSGITEWLPNWQRRGWRTAGRKPVKNQDLWQHLSELAAKHEVKWHWVKGHAGTRGNELADRLANKGLDLAANRPGH
jgi:ribonuclease HI